MCLAVLGRFAEGITYGEDSVRIAEALKSAPAQVTADWHLGVLYLVKGDLDEAIRRLERALSQANDLAFLSPIVVSALGWAHAHAGRLPHALSLLEQGVQANSSRGVISGHAWFTSWLAEAYLLAGRLDSAVEFARRALTLSQTQKERGTEALVLRLLGEIARHPDAPDVPPAEDYYHQALSLADELGMRPLVAHCQFGLGKLYRRTGDREQAQELLTTAAAMFREMGMRFWLEKAETETKEPG